MSASSKKSVAIARMLTVVALIGSATVAHAHPETAAAQPGAPALAGLDTAEHATANPKKKLPKIRKKKKKLPKKFEVKDEPEKQKIPLPSPSSSNDVKSYKQSKSLLVSSDQKVEDAINSTKGAGETNRKADAITGVPIPANLDPLRLAIIEKARGELGKIDSNPKSPNTILIGPETVALKGGIERLAEYNAVAYGTNAGAWANLQELRELVAANEKHTTWCGIFALWAVKMGAGVAASNYEDAWDAVAKQLVGVSPILALLVTNFLPQPGGYLPYKYTYKSLQWGPDGMYLYIHDPSPFDMKKATKEDPPNGELRRRLTPTAISTWLLKQKSVPPIKPGDIGFTQEPRFINGVRQANPTNHHYIVERVMEVGGKYIYFTIEGNYFSQTTKKAQSVVRNYRVYDPNYNYTTAGSGRHIIEAWYDIETLPRFKDNPHM